MTAKKIYIEGGGDSKELRARCREGFRKLLENANFKDRMPRLVACGGRSQTYQDFSAGLRQATNGYTAMLVDSEDVVTDIEKPWDHLQTRANDRWQRPPTATDDQVFLMTTCMETWIVADRRALQHHYAQLNENRLPALPTLETRGRHVVQDALEAATSACRNAYAKGKRSFHVLGKLDPDTLKKYLPSFSRMIRILNQKL
ncbi:conserved hypothetical protein [uncultured Defluviicoccus sp.]|uniref:DUF4276 family protein n=1 Tax=metagenome TaxID=256318 RepID=A0A380TD03_9ZZZZ|nr:conserved hypothetical protein [uncultured Defluviicoccus sp.]